MAIELSGSEMVGICYGTDGDSLPPPSEAIALCKSNNIRKMRIYTPDESILCALIGSNIELMLGVLDEDIQKFAEPSFARSWVQRYVLDYWPYVKFCYIAVGNDVMPHIARTPSLAQYVLSAMKNIHDALSANGMQNHVKVSTTTDLRLLGQLHPPAAGAFIPEVSSFISPIIKFLKSGAPLLLGVYPYWSYANTPADKMSISYALFTTSSPPVKDHHYEYQNVFVAHLDSMYYALEKAEAPNLEIVVCETGWPSEGSERGSSGDHSLTFYSNLVKHVKFGTPKRPQRPVETYLYSLFDENETGHEQCDKHFGLFLQNKVPKYPN